MHPYPLLSEIKKGFIYNFFNFLARNLLISRKINTKYAEHYSTFCPIKVIEPVTEKKLTSISMGRKIKLQNANKIPLFLYPCNGEKKFAIDIYQNPYEPETFIASLLFIEFFK